MSKKTPVKKSKRRLKRTVRKSLAAVLMITAIVIAAIPVPENRAEDGSSAGTARAAATLEYKVSLDADGIVTGQKPGDLNDASNYEKTPNVFVAQGATSGVLDWQYKITKGKNANNRYILDYNTRYLAEDVYLRDSVVSEYETLSMGEYHNFYYENYGTESQTERAVDTITTVGGTDFERVKKYFENYNAFKDFVNGTIPSLEINATAFTNYYGTQSESMMQKYYCEAKKRIGYTLFEVVDLFNNESSSGPDVRCFVYKWVGEGECPDRLDDNNFKIENTTMIKGIADKAFAPKSGSDSAAYRIKNLTLGEQIKVIGDEAFAGCTTLQSINISNVDEIGDGAFEGCTNLSTVTMNPTVIGAEAFQGTNLTGEIVLGNSVTRIGAGAFAYSPISGVNFSNCTNIQISKFAFYNCTGLTKVNFGDSTRNHVKSMGKGCFAVVNSSSAGMT